MPVHSSQNYPIKGTLAFFISPDGMLCQVEGGNHIATVIGNPTKFGVTTEQILRVYDFFGERIGVEGIARKQILTHLIQRGWIRLRRYPNKYWSVTVSGLTNGVTDLLQDWASRFISGFSGFQEPDMHMPVAVTYPFGKLDSFSIKEISEGSLHTLVEEKASPQGPRVAFVESASLLPDRPNMEASSAVFEPRVGILFMVGSDLLVESLPVSEGEDDGDFVNAPWSHYEHWNRLVREAETATEIRISGRSYDHFPRGRCIYSKNSRRFMLYLDPCIVRFDRMLQLVMCKLQIPVEKTDVVSDDPHYKCSECNPLYLPDP